MSDDRERALARTGEVCPSEFGRVSAAIDEAERIGGERIGGPSRHDTKTVEALERRLGRLRPVTGTDWWWYSGRLARALENGWESAVVNALLRLAD